MYKPVEHEYWIYKTKASQPKLKATVPSTTIKTMWAPTGLSLLQLLEKLSTNLTVATNDGGIIAERMTAPEAPQGRQMFSDKVKSFYFYMSVSISTVWIVAIIIIFLMRFYKKRSLITAEKQRRRARPMSRADSIPELQHKSSLRYHQESPQYRSDSPRFRSDSPQQSQLRKSETVVHYDRRGSVCVDNPWEMRQSFPQGPRALSAVPRALSPPLQPIMQNCSRRIVEEDNPQQRLLQKSVATTGGYKRRDSYYSTPNIRDAQSKRKLFLPSISIELR